MTDLQVGDRVRVTFPDAMYTGRKGTVINIHHDNPAARWSGCPILDVQLDDDDVIIIPAKAVAPLSDDHEQLRAAVHSYLTALTTAPGTTATQMALDHMATLVEWPISAGGVLSEAERYRTGGIGHPEYELANAGSGVPRMKGGTEPTCPACFGDGHVNITCELCRGSGCYDLSPTSEETDMDMNPPWRVQMIRRDGGGYDVNLVLSSPRLTLSEIEARKLAAALTVAADQMQGRDEDSTVT